MSEDSVELLDRFRDGDDEAAHELFNRYVDRLVALARTRLSAQMKRRVEPEEVVQSAYRSFFRKAGEGKFTLDKSGRPLETVGDHYGHEGSGAG